MKPTFANRFSIPTPRSSRDTSPTSCRFSGPDQRRRLLQLIVYIKSLSPPTTSPAKAAARRCQTESQNESPHSPSRQPRRTPNYLNVDYGWKSWLFTTDHKRIALLYLFSITAFFFLGGVFAVAMRMNLLTPEGLFSHDTYNKLFTMHGIIMVFFFLVPSIPATLGNFLMPMMIGARDLAFPRINLLSWYIYIVGGIIALDRDRRRRRRYRLDVLCALQLHLFEYPRDPGRDGRLRLRLFVDSHRPELHRHHPQDARSGHDLVAACRCSFGGTTPPA